VSGVAGAGPELGQRLASTRCIVENDWFSVHHDEVVDDAGRRSDYWVVRRPPYVLVVPRLAGGGAVGLVRRFRYPVGLWFWEFPQGRAPGPAPGPDDVEATATELARSVAGDGAGGRDGGGVRVELLGRFYEAYGFADHQCYCYLAEVEAPAGDAGVRWEPAGDLVDVFAEAPVADASSVAALTLLGARDRARAGGRGGAP
jgi:hypothetical protein